MNCYNDLYYVTFVREWGRVEGTNMQQKSIPLLSIWRHPRRTMRGLIARRSLVPAYIFASASGIVNAVDFIQGSDWIDQYADGPMKLAYAVGGGIVSGILFLLLLSLLFMFFGRWVGGQGKFSDLTTAVGWAMLPFIGTLAVTIIEFFLYGEAYLTGGEALAQAQAAQPVIDLILMLITLFFAVYAIVFLIAGLAEAHRIKASQGAAVLMIFVILYLVLLITVQALSIGI